MNSGLMALSVIRLLMVDSDLDYVEKVKQMLSRAKIAMFDLTVAHSIQECESKFENKSFNAALLEIDLSDSKGISTIKKFRKICSSIPIVVISKVNDELISISAIQAGVQDYLVKDTFDEHMLARTISFAIERDQSIVMLNDVHRRQEEHFLNHDLLTGLPNKHYALETLNKQMRDKTYKKISIISFKVIGLKSINEALGISFADELLIILSGRIKSLCKDTDILARIETDEFVLAAHDYRDINMLVEIVERLLENIKLPVIIVDSKIMVTCSVGISLYPDHGSTAEELLRAAYVAGTFSNKIGSKSYLFYSNEIQVLEQQQNVIRRDITTAIFKKEFFLCYQPKVNVSDGVIIGAEALIRWKHPELGLISPAYFIPMAESLNEINEITTWVALHVIEIIKKLNKLTNEQPIEISLNLSAVQLNDDYFNSELKSLFMLPKEILNCLDFEITETAMMKNPKKSFEILKMIREAGIHISIDDFGTGYSSLNYLKDLPADVIKIDRSFIVDMMNMPSQMEIVKSTIQLIHKLGLVAIAEGVEYKSQLDVLRRLHCDQIQGFYFSQPVLESEFFNLVKKQPFRTH